MTLLQVENTKYLMSFLKSFIHLTQHKATMCYAFILKEIETRVQLNF
jgi:hypothetical protein